MRGRAQRANALKSLRKTAGAIPPGLPVMGAPAPNLPAPGPPQAIPGPVPGPPGQPPIAAMKKGGKVPATGNYKLHAGETVLPAATAGATDGLGSGRGGLAIHQSAKGANIGGYEPRHSSKQR